MKCQNTKECKCQGCKEEKSFLNRCRKTASEMTIEEINVKRFKYMEYKKYPKTKKEAEWAELSNFWASVWYVKSNNI